jgi:hypothetical protein
MSQSQAETLAAREKAIQLFIQALQAKPSMLNDHTTSKAAAEDIVAGAQEIANFLCGPNRS